MRTDDFDFDLPADRIALRPVTPRDSARLLVVDPRGGALRLDDRHVRDLPELLEPGDCLVVNDTRVIPARLSGTRRRGAGVARIDATLVKRLDGARWQALARPAKRLRPGDVIDFARPDGAALAATVIARDDGGSVELGFAQSGAALDAAIAANGEMPLPPYIAGRRQADPADRRDYQSMFAARDGAVAAPTAGLHFTEALMQRLRARGVLLETVTLHVGAGTFLPVTAEDTAAHRMHAEWGGVSAATAGRLNAVRAAGRRIVAVGTTALRILETAAAGGRLAAFAGETTIFITPGHRFAVVDALVTNFHLPRSTLVMLVAAFSGHETQKSAYAHAIGRHYRFYSYGDAGLWFRAEPD
jgi:S-adenosylmethionine:tRNA ribosyltransferase-isomerase